MCVCHFFKWTDLQINKEKRPPFRVIVIGDFSVTWGSKQKIVIPPALLRKIPPSAVALAACWERRPGDPMTTLPPLPGAQGCAGWARRKNLLQPCCSAAPSPLVQPSFPPRCSMVIKWHQPAAGRLLIILQTSRKVWGVRGSWKRWRGRQRLAPCRFYFGLNRRLAFIRFIFARARQAFETRFKHLSCL